MSRRHASEKRRVLPDARFGDFVVAKFMNNIMKAGMKSVAERIVYGALDKIHGRNGKDSLEIFHEAVSNVRPFLEVKSRRVGGATYQVPTEVRSDRAQALCIRWLIAAAQKRSEKTMIDQLAGELWDASNNKGAAIKKKEDTHKMAEANRAFAHYRW